MQTIVNKLDFLFVYVHHLSRTKHNISPFLFPKSGHYDLSTFSALSLKRLCFSFVSRQMTFMNVRKENYSSSIVGQTRSQIIVGNLHTYLHTDKHSNQKRSLKKGRIFAGQSIIGN